MDPRPRREGKARGRATPPHGFWSPSYALPAAVVVAGLLLAFLVRPSGGGGGGVRLATLPAAEETPLASPTATPTPAREGPSPSSTPPSHGGFQAEVAGARATPTPAAGGRVFVGANDCGRLQEAVYPLAVEQGLQGVTVSVRGATVYPLEYLQCVLAGMEGAEAEALAEALAERYREGHSHAVLLDLWVTNGARTFAQVNLRNGSFAAAGQTFPPVATVGGRAEVVLGSGQGRSIALLATVRNDVGTTTGPLTLVLEPPIVGGEPVPGKYQLFLPLP